MAQVVLIPTGRLEHAALGPSLKRLFPAHDFLPRPKDQHHDGFTSVDVAHITLRGAVPSNVDELAAELVASVSPGQRGKPADFAFLVEDLELLNDHQPARVVAVFRDAVERHVRVTWPSQAGQDRTFALVRERCSFHLFRPMTETYFYGEPAALQRAGAARPPQLPANLDFEAFQASDQPFLQFPNGQCDRIVDMPHRQRHPKSYLHFLCDPTLADKKRRYRETRGGVDALSRLDWAQVLSSPPHCPFLHAFLDDLADALNHPLPFVDKAHACPITQFAGRQNLLLRNI